MNDFGLNEMQEIQKQLQENIRINGVDYHQIKDVINYCG